MRRPLLLALALSLVLTACSGAAGSDRAGADEAGATAGALTALTGGDPLPEAVLPSLTDESVSVDTADLRGTPTILNFWATWCAFCVEEMPDMETASQALGDGVRFVGVDREDPNREAARELAAETGVTYELLIDADGSFFRAVQGRGMPTTVFVDEDGVIRYRHAGPLSAEQLLELAEEHLGLTAA